MRGSESRARGPPCKTGDLRPSRLRYLCPTKTLSLGPLPGNGCLGCWPLADASLSGRRELGALPRAQNAPETGVMEGGDVVGTS